MFEKASRLKLRFDTARGQLSVEDLWDLPLQSPAGKPAVNLDDVAKALYKTLKESDAGLSFVTPATKSDDVTALKFELVKHVIAIKLAEQEAALKAKSNAEKKQQLLGLIAQKEVEQLAGNSLDDLKALAASL